MNLLVQKGINRELVQHSQKSPSIAGRLALFKDYWQLITTDQWVLNNIQGYEIEFMPHPVQHHPPRERVPSTQESLLLEEEIQKLLTKGAVVKVRNTKRTEGFYSSLFLVHKKARGLRPTINLKSLNQLITTVHFKIEGIHTVKELLSQYDWLTKVDLKDAYFMITIREADRPKLHFLAQRHQF